MKLQFVTKEKNLHHELYLENKYFHKNHTANLVNICKKCHLTITKNNTIHRKTKTTEGYKLVPQ